MTLTSLSFAYSIFDCQFKLDTDEQLLWILSFFLTKCYLYNIVKESRQALRQS